MFQWETPGSGVNGNFLWPTKSAKTLNRQISPWVIIFVGTSLVAQSDFRLGHFEVRWKPQALCHSHPAEGQMSLGCATVTQGVIDLIGGLDGWFVSIGVHFNVRVQVNLYGARCTDYLHYELFILVLTWWLILMASTLSIMSCDAMTFL